MISKKYDTYGVTAGVIKFEVYIQLPINQVICSDMITTTLGVIPKLRLCLILMEKEI